MLITPLLLMMAAANCEASLAEVTAALQHNALDSASKLLASTPPLCSQTSSYFALKGVVNELSGKGLEAEEAFRMAIRLDPSSGRAREQLGAALLRNGKPQEAIAPLKEAANLDPSNPTIDKYLIAAYSGSGDWNSAAPLFSHVDLQEALLHDPAVVMLWIQALTHTGRIEAIRRGLPRPAPGVSSAVLFNLGTLLGKSGLYPESVDYLKLVPESDADEAAFFNLGLAYSHLRDFDSARKCYFSAIDRHPEYVESYLHVGLDYAATGQQHKAVPWLNRAHEISPARADITYALSEQLIELGYFDSAQQLLATAGEDEDAALARGDLALAEGKLADAGARYRRALAGNPRCAPAMSGLARLATAEGHDAEAIAQLNRALSIAPDDPGSNAELGLIENRQRDWAAARIHLAAAWKSGQNTLDIACALAAAERHTGDQPAALALLQSLPAGVQAAPAVHLELAQIYQESKRFSDARAERDQATRLEAQAHNGLHFDPPRSYVF